MRIKYSTPKKWGQKDPDWLSFLNFYKAHVKQAIEIAKEIADETDNTLFNVILRNTLSPLAYVYEEWQVMTSEQKLPYVTDPEYKKKLQKIIEESKAIAEKAFPKEETSE